MVAPFARPNRRRLRMGSIVYPWGNPARAEVVKSWTKGEHKVAEINEKVYKVRFIDDNIASIHWWMQILVFPKGHELILERDQISDHPQR